MCQQPCKVLGIQSWIRQCPATQVAPDQVRETDSKQTNMIGNNWEKKKNRNDSNFDSNLTSLVLANQGNFMKVTSKQTSKA